jgi:hypothetical protein
MWCAHTTNDRPPVAEDVLARVRREKVRHDAEGRQRDDVDLRVPEEPEQVLEQQRAAAGVLGRAAHGIDRGHEEAGAERAVERHHDRGDEQRREGEEAEDRRGEDAPHRERHAHQRHAPAARLEHGRHVVEAAHGEGDDEDAERHQHQDDAEARSRRPGQHRLRRVERPARAGRPARHEEAREQHDDRDEVDPEAQHVHVREHHVARAAHERNEVIAEPAEEEGGQQVDHHDHPVHRDELVIAVRVDEVELLREAQLQAHQRREHERHQADEYRHDGVLDRDDLVVLAPDVLLDESVRIVDGGIAVRDCDVSHQSSLPSVIAVRAGAGSSVLM